MRAWCSEVGAHIAFSRRAANIYARTLAQGADAGRADRVLEGRASGATRIPACPPPADRPARRACTRPSGPAVSHLAPVLSRWLSTQHHPSATSGEPVKTVEDAAVHICGHGVLLSLRLCPSIGSSILPPLSLLMASSMGLQYDTLQLICTS